MKTTLTPLSDSRMHPVRRELVLRVMDGCSNVGPVVWHFDRLTRCEEILRWLIANHKTGQQLLDWMRFRGDFALGIAKFVISQIDRDKELKPILAGRDYRLAGRG